MTDPLLHVYVAVRSAHIAGVARLAKDERGEGVISAAIAVLIMAFLGTLMWVGFRAIFMDAQRNTGDQVNQIGQ